MHLVTKRHGGERRDQLLEIGARQVGRQCEGEEREPRLGAHGREIAQVDRKRPVSDGRRRGKAAIEVHALDDRVDRQHLEAVSRRHHHRRIVADADDEPVRRRRQLLPDALDELGFGEVGNGSHRDWKLGLEAGG